MQQRQLRLGDILDDYCPRERRLTNHVVVAMIGDDVKQTRCSTCDAEHEFKHAKVPRQRRKSETPAALYASVAANGPKRVAHDPPGGDGSATELSRLEDDGPTHQDDAAAAAPVAAAAESTEPAETMDHDDEPEDAAREHGPVHRPLIRASLPRHEGQPPPTRPIPEFTIRQPTARPGARFRPRGPRPGSGGGQQFQGNRNGNLAGPPRGMRQGGGGGGRPPQGGGGGMARRHGPGRKRSK